MSALTNSMAHELAQPLSAITLNAEALRKMVTANRAPPDTMDEILSDIQSQGALAGQIIDRHRRMLRSRQLRKQPIDLNAVIDDSVALVAHDMKARQVEATVNLSSNPCIISGDPVLLGQVLVNLVVNAMDAMAETPRERRRLTITSNVTPTTAEVGIRDSGPGLRVDTIESLLEPFVTTKAHGVGIGLTIARRIVDAHGGPLTRATMLKGVRHLRSRSTAAKGLRSRQVAGCHKSRQRVVQRLKVARGTAAARVLSWGRPLHSRPVSKSRLRPPSADPARLGYARFLPS